MKWFRRKPAISPEAEYIEKLNQDAKARELAWNPSVAAGILYLPEGMSFYGLPSDKIDASKITSGTITASKIEAGMLTTDKIYDGSITWPQLRTRL